MLGVTITPRLHRLLTIDAAELAPFERLDVESAVGFADIIKVRNPDLTCFPFARRRDCDDLFVFVKDHPVYECGQILPVDMECNEYLICDPYPSADAWARDVWSELGRWRSVEVRPGL